MKKFIYIYVYVYVCNSRETLTEKAWVQRITSDFSLWHAFPAGITRASDCVQSFFQPQNKYQAVWASFQALMKKINQAFET